jgi:hypothetical protein
MSKRGDTYLRTLLIHGARSAIVAAQRNARVNPWLAGLAQQRNANIAAVALANKNARTVWALLAHDREFRPDYFPSPAAAQFRPGRRATRSEISPQRQQLAEDGKDRRFHGFGDTIT